MTQPFRFNAQRDMLRAGQLRQDGMERLSAVGAAIQTTSTWTTTDGFTPAPPLTAHDIRINESITRWISITINPSFSSVSGTWLFGMDEALQIESTDGLCGTWRAVRASTGDACEGLVVAHSDRTKIKITYQTAYPVGAPAFGAAGFPWLWTNGDTLDILVIGRYPKA